MSLKSTIQKLHWQYQLKLINLAHRNAPAPDQLPCIRIKTSSAPGRYGPFLLTINKKYNIKRLKTNK